LWTWREQFCIITLCTVSISLDRGLSPCCSSFTPEKQTRYLLYRSTGRPQGQSGGVWKISPPTGIETRTVQPTASHYTDYAIPAANK
jgi:hypothetical protein